MREVVDKQYIYVVVDRQWKFGSDRNDYHEYFCYKLQLPSEATYYCDIEEGTGRTSVKTDFVNRKSVGYVDKVPKKTVVYNHYNSCFIPLQEAWRLFDDEYIDKHRRQVDDKEEIWFTHRKALEEISRFIQKEKPSLHAILLLKESGNVILATGI